MLLCRQSPRSTQLWAPDGNTTLGSSPMGARFQVVPLISACLRTNDIALRIIINILDDVIVIVINFNIITIIIKYQTILGTLPDKP